MQDNNVAIHKKRILRVRHTLTLQSIKWQRKRKNEFHLRAGGKTFLNLLL